MIAGVPPPRLASYSTVRSTEEIMASLMLLLDGPDADVAVGQAAARGLARLGITALALFRDETTLGVVIDGWAFASGAADEAARVLLPGGRRLRVLPPVFELALSTIPPDTTERTRELR